VREAFAQPLLYQEVMERCATDGSVPAKLDRILTRYHRIEDVAAEDAAKVFIASGKFAGVINDDGLISKEPDEGQAGGYEEAPGPGRENREEGEAPAKPSGWPDASLVTPDVATRSYSYPLTRGRTAQLVVPYDLDKTDLQLLTKQVELLAIAIGDVPGSAEEREATGES